MSSFLLSNGLTAQTLVVTLNKLPPSGGSIRILCELDRTVVHQTQFDYAPGTSDLQKVLQLPTATGYLLRATVSRGLGKFPLIVASGKSDNLDIAAGSQGTKIVFRPPEATLMRGAAVQGGTAVLLKYDDGGALLRAGDVGTMWCTDKTLKINTSGRQILAPIKLGPDGRQFVVFIVPNSDRTTYCQAGYYSEQLTPTAQIPIFVYPDLTTGAAPFNVSPFSASGTTESSAEQAQSSDGRKSRRISIITPGKDGHLQRTITTEQH
jgi:hypothetical protein